MQWGKVGQPLWPGQSGSGVQCWGLTVGVSVFSTLIWRSGGPSQGMQVAIGALAGNPGPCQGHRHCAWPWVQRNALTPLPDHSRPPTRVAAPAPFNDAKAGRDRGQLAHRARLPESPLPRETHN